MSFGTRSKVIASFVVALTATAAFAQGPPGGGGGGQMGCMGGGMSMAGGMNAGGGGMNTGMATGGSSLQAFSQMEQSQSRRWQSAVAATRANILQQRADVDQFWDRAYQRGQRVRQAREAYEDVKAQRIAEKKAKAAESSEKTMLAKQ